MIGFEQALETLLSHARRMDAERLAAGLATGRVLARDVASPMALPSFDHAAMDGYALATQGHRLDAGSEHDVLGSQAAGDDPRSSAGMAWEIMTGARLPDGLDAVIPVERIQLLASRSDGSPARIRLLEALERGANVRYAGSDVARDSVALRAGTVIAPPQIMLLASIGVTAVEVSRRPRVAIICTGKELQADLGHPLSDSEIYNSNGPYLSASLVAMGMQVVSCETVDDTALTYADALARAREAGADLVLSTGAVSMGRYDFVPDTLRSQQAELLFHKVAMRPGKPVLAARFDDGVIVLALPGTPMAVAVGFRFFVAPLLRAMQGQPAEPAWHAVLADDQQPKPGLRHFLRASLAQDGEGRWIAHVMAQPQPFRIRPFAEADGWVVLPDDAGPLLAGTRVVVAGLQPGVLPPFADLRPQGA
jgi:molybdopterin molybdotransferase